MSRVGKRSFAAAPWALLALVALATGCPGPKSHVGDSADGSTGDGGTGAGDLLLVRVGQGSLLIHPGDPTSLIAQLTLTGSGQAAGVPDSAVTFSVTRMPGPITLSATTATTGACDPDASTTCGLAEIQVTCQGPGEFALEAESPGATSSAVWKLDCEPVIETLSIVGTSAVTPTDPPTDSMATATAPFGTSIPLQVLVTEEGATAPIPLANQSVQFTLASEAGAAGFGGNSSITVTTNPQGIATANLFVGNNVGADIVQASLTNNGAPPVSFNINVTLGCMSASDCPDGTCDLATHQCTTGASPTSCDVGDTGCPLGYTCVNGACAVAGAMSCTSCPMGYTCDTATMMCVPTNPQCTTNADCPNGQCMNGICINNTSNVIDVTGHWYTIHNFDVSAALPGWLSFTQTAVRVIDQVLNGQISGIPSWADAIIQAVVQAYVPSWVTQLVSLLDDLLTLFNNLIAEGEMDLTAIGGNNALLNGTESWTMFDFYLLSQCNGNISGNPSTPPPCALFNVYTSDLAAVNLSVTVDPFTAAVQGGNGSPYILQVDPRTVEMSFAGLILYVVDQAVEAITGYPSLQGPPGDPQDGALFNIIDCSGLAQQLMSSGVPIDITGICDALVEAAANAIAQQLQAITISTDVLSFSGHATAWADPTDPAYTDMTYATDLGYSDYNTRMPSDGLWNANFSIIGTISNVPGSWYASRDPMQ